MIRIRGLKGRQHFFRSSFLGALATVVAFVLLGTQVRARAGLTISATYGSGFTADDETAINTAITTLENDIANPITVSIQFQTMSSGLGGGDTYVYGLSYYQYYNAVESVATMPAQLSALASLGPAPTSPSSGNPVNGNTTVYITGPLARALGFNASPPAGQPDTIISLNTSIAVPPDSLTGSNYSIQSTAQHELDDALGIGGTGSELDGTDSLTGPVGPLDLYRCSAPGVRSYSNTQATSPYAYFSIDGGSTVLSYFNQTTGARFGDWLSNPIPAGFAPQVQDAFGDPGTNPVLGVNELTALNVVGYSLTPIPEPATMGLVAFASVAALSRRRRSAV